MRCLENFRGLSSNILEQKITSRAEGMARFFDQIASFPLSRHLLRSLERLGRETELPSKFCLPGNGVRILFGPPRHFFARLDSR